jgi:hypothetical protein
VTWSAQHRCSRRSTYSQGARWRLQHLGLCLEIKEVLERAASMQVYCTPPAKADVSVGSLKAICEE